MKTKRKQFVQILAHEIEDEVRSWQHIEASLPQIGRIIMYFNGLEKMLDSMLCDIFSDRSDAPGLIVLQNMHYSAKVNLFSRFSDEYHRAIGEVPPSYVGLLDKLRNAAKERNIVAHADWENTDNDGFTFSMIRFSDGGMEQEYVQLTSDSLEAVLRTLLAARVQLGEYYDAKSGL